MTMTNEEIARDYRLAKNGLKQAHILAEQNLCSVDEIVRILQEQGIKVDGRLTQKGKPHASPKKAAAAPAATPKPTEPKEAAPKPEKPEAEKPKPDPVNHPQHYTRGGIECIDAIMAAVSGLHGAEAFLASQVIKYTWRYKWKNGAEDLKKARFYLDRLIQETENGGN